MSATEKIHAQIWDRHRLRVVGARLDVAVLVSDDRRAVYRITVPGGHKGYRVAWWESLRDHLDTRPTLTPDAGADYRQYAR
ncbi:hypothetical protein ACMT4L_16755 [Deinococcus sp. A31D244]|uniref:hypothetical protein n=1 Tax=Deinococcus sp. A31D244 TaxID=3397675 RepID=UPI0039E179DA